MIHDILLYLTYARTLVLFFPWPAFLVTIMQTTRLMGHMRTNKRILSKATYHVPFSCRYKQRNVIQDARLRHFIRDVVFTVHYYTVKLKMKRSSQSKVYEKDVWDIQVDSLSETRYTVSVFDVKRLNPSLSRLDLIWFELLVRPASGETGLWVQCMVLRILNSPSYRHGPTYTDHDTVLSQAVLYHTLYYL